MQHNILLLIRWAGGSALLQKLTTELTFCDFLCCFNMTTFRIRLTALHLPPDIVAFSSVTSHRLWQQDRISITAAFATHACIAWSYAVLWGRHMTLWMVANWDERAVNVTVHQDILDLYSRGMHRACTYGSCKKGTEWRMGICTLAISWATSMGDLACCTWSLEPVLVSNTGTYLCILILSTLFGLV